MCHCWYCSHLESIGLALRILVVIVGALRRRVLSEALQTDMRKMALSSLLAPRLAIVAIADGLVIRGTTLLALAVSLVLAFILALARLSRISRGGLCT